MMSGCRPMIGMKRSICIEVSTTSSPSRVSPAANASTTPMGSPTARPISTRCSETQIADGREPSAILSQADPHTADGPERVSSVVTPVL